MNRRAPQLPAAAARPIGNAVIWTLSLHIHAVIDAARQLVTEAAARAMRPSDDDITKSFLAGVAVYSDVPVASLY
jgi:hypothetical protein